MSQQFFRFVIVGVLGFAVDAGLTYAFVFYGLRPVIARIPALGAAIFTTWLLNRYVTFKLHQRGNPSEVIRYFAVAIASATLNFGIYTVLILAGLKSVIAIGISTLLLMFFSFFGYKIFAFKLRR